MPVDGILAAIRAEAGAEIERVRAEAEAEAADILTRARREAAAVVEHESASRDTAAAEDAQRIVSRARLEAERLRREATEVVYQDLLGEVRQRLGALRGTTRYREILGRFLDECLTAVPAATEVLVDPADTDVAQEVTTAAGRTMRVVATLSCLGGLDVATDDGRFVRNTFEARLRKADGHLRLLAAETMPLLRGGA